MCDELSAGSWALILFGLFRLCELLPRQYLLIDCVTYMKRANRLKRNNTTYSLFFLIAHAAANTIQVVTHHFALPFSCGGASMSGYLNLLPMVDVAGSILIFLVLLTVALLWLELAEAAMKMQSVKSGNVEKYKTVVRAAAALFMLMMLVGRVFAPVLVSIAILLAVFGCGFLFPYCGSRLVALMVKDEAQKACCVFMCGSMRKTINAVVTALCPKPEPGFTTAEEGKTGVDAKNKAKNAARQIELLCGRLILNGIMIAMFGILLTPSNAALADPSNPAGRPTAYTVVFFGVTFSAQLLAHSMLRYVRFQAFLGDPNKAFGKRRSSSGNSLSSRLSSSFGSSVASVSPPATETTVGSSDDADASAGSSAAGQQTKVHPVG